ncbi:collagen-binding domain-containing protein [Leuconostoc rapi]|uniref:collagen-binding domain-containing protein n=1 Tax=Leuconostoc rapi TaxID=1406906 RepID=UPI0039EC2011
MTNKRSIITLATSMLFVRGAVYFQHTNDKSEMFVRSSRPSQYEMKPLANEASSSTEDGAIMSSSNSSSENSKKPESEAPKITSRAVISDSGLPTAGNWTDDFKNVNQNNALGIAGQFNVFARNMDTTQNHPVDGNFATQTVKTQSWVVNGNKSLSYVQNNITSDGDSIGFNSDTLILGQSFNYNPDFQWGRPAINGIRLDTAPKNLRQDANGSKYIDFDAEFNRLSTSSENIAHYSKNNVPIVTNYYGLITFDVTNIPAKDNIKYMTVKASDLSGMNNRLNVTGVAANQRIVITVDTTGVNDVSTTNLTFVNGTEDKGIFFNYYNEAGQSNFAGNVNLGTTNDNIGAVLAPQATVTLATTAFKGNIVAKNFINNYMGEQSGNYSDIAVPTTDTPSSKPKLLSVPDIDFGDHKIGSQNSVVGEWRGNFALEGHLTSSKILQLP